MGRLWTSLADYYIRHGNFERARDVYEEGMNSVVTVHDFSLIYDALTQFEESLLTAKMEALGMDEDQPQEEVSLAGLASLVWATTSAGELQTLEHQAAPRQPACGSLSRAFESCYLACL